MIEGHHSRRNTCGVSLNVTRREPALLSVGFGDESPIELTQTWLTFEIGFGWPLRWGILLPCLLLIWFTLHGTESRCILILTIGRRRLLLWLRNLLFLPFLVESVLVLFGEGFELCIKHGVLKGQHVFDRIARGEEGVYYWLWTSPSRSELPLRAFETVV